MLIELLTEKLYQLIILLILLYMAILLWKMADWKESLERIWNDIHLITQEMEEISDTLWQWEEY